MELKPIFLNGGVYKVSSGSQEDNWLKDIPLSEQYLVLYNIVNRKHDTVATVMSTIPLNISFRRALVGNELKAWHDLGLKVPLKIKFFIWLLFRGVILTKDNLIRRHWLGSKQCCFCSADETIQYLFFACPCANRHIGQDFRCCYTRRRSEILCERHVVIWRPPQSRFFPNMDGGLAIDFLLVPHHPRRPAAAKVRGVDSKVHPAYHDEPAVPLGSPPLRRRRRRRPPSAAAAAEPGQQVRHVLLGAPNEAGKPGDAAARHRAARGGHRLPDDAVAVVAGAGTDPRAHIAAVTASNAVQPDSPLTRAIRLGGRAMSWRARLRRGGAPLVSAAVDLCAAITEAGRRRSASSQRRTGATDGGDTPRASSPTAVRNCPIPAPSARIWFQVTPTTYPPHENSVTCTSSRGSTTSRQNTPGQLMRGHGVAQRAARQRCHERHALAGARDAALAVQAAGDGVVVSQCQRQGPPDRLRGLVDRAVERDQQPHRRRRPLAASRHYGGRRGAQAASQRCELWRLGRAGGEARGQAHRQGCGCRLQAPAARERGRQGVRVLFKRTHWLRFWAQLQRMDDQMNLLVKACQRLESQAMQFFASRGWPFPFHLSC
ncbi:hypothetical protein U9M48_037011 [Paspalum notatum var. saurae]|uniref:Reverse transcriptase zinc-binding domain-containing protein n=1 Tax=Paspalum notatum var. saurae TaxID=547442 RepID=A0AAQ3UIR5_PASNO